MATLTSLAGGSMARFTRRFMGALVLDPVTFEDVEADIHAGGQAAIVSDYRARLETGTRAD